MYVNPITRQTYDYATPITCDYNPRNIIELDPNSDDQDFYILEPEPIIRKPPLMFTPFQTKTTIRPNTFTPQDAGIYSNLINFGIEFYSLNTLILHFDYLVKPLVNILFLLILLIMMQIPLMVLVIYTIHYVLDYMINFYT